MLKQQWWSNVTQRSVCGSCPAFYECFNCSHAVIASVIFMSHLFNFLTNYTFTALLCVFLLFCPQFHCSVCSKSTITAKKTKLPHQHYQQLKLKYHQKVMELNGIKLNYTDTHLSRVPPVYITETFCVFFCLLLKVPYVRISVKTS